MTGFKQFLFELEHLHAIHKDRGQQFLDDLLNQHIAVNIKIDQNALVAENTGKELAFFGREGKRPITKINRAGIDLYEDSIKHLQSRPWQKLPKNVEIYLENFTDRFPSIIKYTGRPKNNLIISYLKKDGKIIRPDDPLNKVVADILDVSPPPVLFSGTLSPKQKQMIQDFAAASPEEREQKYGKTKFLDFVLSLFTHPKELEWLKKDGYEGLVFYFGKDNPISAKIVDPLFTAEIKTKKATKNPVHSVLRHYVYENLRTVLENALSTFKADPKKDAEDNYINFISHLTKIFVDTYGNQIDADLEGHKHEAHKRFAGITYHLLPGYMKDLAAHHWWVEDLFSMLLFLLKGEKKRVDAATELTPERKQLVNDVVADLRKKGVLNV